MDIVFLVIAAAVFAAWWLFPASADKLFDAADDALEHKPKAESALPPVYALLHLSRYGLIGALAVSVLYLVFVAPFILALRAFKRLVS